MRRTASTAAPDDPGVGAAAVGGGDANGAARDGAGAGAGAGVGGAAGGA